MAYDGGKDGGEELRVEHYQVTHSHMRRGEVNQHLSAMSQRDVISDVVFSSCLLSSLFLRQRRGGTGCMWECLLPVLRTRAPSAGTLPTEQESESEEGSETETESQRERAREKERKSVEGCEREGEERKLNQRERKRERAEEIGKETRRKDAKNQTLPLL